MFGKPLAYYVRLQAYPLAAILVIFLARLSMSSLGIPGSVEMILSVTLVQFLALPYYALLAKRENLSFRHLYAMGLTQSLFAQTLIALAIVLGIFTGRDNIYTIPEFYPVGLQGPDGPFPVDGKNWMHAGAHVLFAGLLVPPLVYWGISSVCLVIARRVKSW
jgi:hypothetical protein